MSSTREPPRRRATGASTSGLPGPSTTRPTAIGRAGSRLGVRSSTATARNVRHGSVVASRIDRSGAVSPTGSVSSVATTGTKRKERDFDAEAGAGDGNAGTNINVVVRCRGRNDREVRENSAVVVSTAGVKGAVVDLSMGPNALSNKTYNFDRVYSSAADQSMIFEDTVKPILDEMLTGYNCTIFAYGQTGTGKTYTMTGDMQESMGILSDAAGIIPRVLQALFNKLEAEESDNCVRCSFIELYNEELRDLLSADDGAKLRIYDDNSRKGHSTTVVQGMEERHITSAAEGIKRLQEGSVRRQVAATKCNDLSSRSHTVFTITVYVKRPGENGEDYVSAGKLNLVDLAGSENIQRSGAENKRAAEAGLINKSLLTLGRVINALVDRSAQGDKSHHIPYRESKLTRLLQDSLGGQTKTCIIATISPAKSNLEETISTLDYAFRAKNIRNKPQIKTIMSKHTLLREFTAEIEKLRGELVTTRQRNGVYLSNESYEELTVQNESRRILTEEQSAKIETMETNLRNKVQELFDLTSSFMGLKKENEGTKAQLDDTKEVLDQTEVVLTATRKALGDETELRKAHQETEEKLATLGNELIGTLDRTVRDVSGLRAKNKRKSDLQSLNRSTWATSQDQVADVTEMVEGRIQEFRQDQEEHISSVSERVEFFVQAELQKLSETQAFLDEHIEQFAASKEQLLEHKAQSKQEMDAVLDEIKVVRDNIKERVGESLQVIAGAAERIAADVVSELSQFHSQLQSSYNSLGKDFKAMFEDLSKTLISQRTESDKLRRQLEGASESLIQSNAVASSRIQEIVAEERRQAAEERKLLLAQITLLINNQGDAQETRLSAKASQISQDMLSSTAAFEDNIVQYSEGMETWADKDSEMQSEVGKSNETLKTKVKEDWNVSCNTWRCLDCSSRRMLTRELSRPPTSTAPRSRPRPSPSTPRQSVLSTSRCETSTCRCRTWMASSLEPGPRTPRTSVGILARCSSCLKPSRLRTETFRPASKMALSASRPSARSSRLIMPSSRNHWSRWTLTSATPSRTYETPYRTLFYRSTSPRAIRPKRPSTSTRRISRGLLFPHLGWRGCMTTMGLPPPPQKQRPPSSMTWTAMPRAYCARGPRRRRQPCRVPSALATSRGTRSALACVK
ncbi:hypothetical protein RB598_001458 [Gaeumannomyces tritici]